MWLMYPWGVPPHSTHILSATTSLYCPNVLYSHIYFHYLHTVYAFCTIYTSVYIQLASVSLRPLQCDIQGNNIPSKQYHRVMATGAPKANRHSSVSTLSQWFLNILSNPALTARLAAKAWFDRSFKDHRLLTILLILIRMASHIQL